MKVYSSLKPYIKDNPSTCLLLSHLNVFLDIRPLQFGPSKGTAVNMTDQIPPAQNDSHVSALSTLHEPEYLASRTASVFTLLPAVSPDASAYRTTARSSPTHHAAPDCRAVHSLDGHTAGTSHFSGPTDSGRKLSQESTYEGQSSIQSAKRTIFRSWWREILATIFSITSMGLVLLLVLKINSTSLESWDFHVGSITIQPNTLISVLTTIGQTLMMVPVTACIGQLKWRYFRRPRHLHHMQLMDDASRGPWGSLLLLSRLASTRAATASLLALVTILALGIGPSAQQILEFRPAQVLLKNATAEIGLATNYSSKSYVSQYGSGSGRASYTTTYNNDIFKLQSSVIDGLAGSVFVPNFDCPGNICTWPDFTSLGVCGNYYNLTGSMDANCTGDRIALNCTYEVPHEFTESGHNRTVTVLFSDQTNALDPPTTIFQSTWVTEVNSPVGILAVKVSNANERPTYKPPATEVSFSKWNWCAKTYKNATASPAGITGGTVVSEGLFKSGSLSNEKGDSGSGYFVYTTQSGRDFYVDKNTQLQLFAWLGAFLERSIIDSYPRTNTQVDSDSFNLGFFLYASDLNVVTQNLADTLTNQIRSTSPGDNLNTTKVAGNAYITETYIRIRWQWIVVPLAEAVLTCVLLIISIFTTRSEPLLKSSVLAFLFHPLEGLRAKDLNMNEINTPSKLEEVSETMMAKLETGKDGRVRFCAV